MFHCLRFTVPGSRLLPAHLPGFYCVDRSNQHEDFEQQAIVNPDDKDQFTSGKQNQRTSQAESLRDQKSSNAAENVAERIDDRVAVIAQCSGGGAIAFDNEIRIFKSFPCCFDGSCQQQLRR